jgi:hypothetical protein
MSVTPLKFSVMLITLLRFAHSYCSRWAHDTLQTADLSSLSFPCVLVATAKVSLCTHVDEVVLITIELTSDDGYLDGGTLLRHLDGGFDLGKFEAMGEQ